MVQAKKEESSFRDPAGQVIIKGGVYLRKVNPSYMDDYKQLISSGLYDELAKEKLLLPHTERPFSKDGLVLVPEQVKFISYPYEWCFSMLKEAALNTLEINRIALEHGMMLKDASAFNIQWHNGELVLIDTLSFIRYNGNQPWIAYRQFLEHFLVPLLLIKYRDSSLSRLSGIFLDGIPVNLATKLLPLRLRVHPPLIAHLYAQALAKGNEKEIREIKMPQRNLDALLDNLRGLVEGLKYKPKSEWSAYDSCSYTEKAFKSKYNTVEGLLKKLPIVLGDTLCDIGANTGVFSELALTRGYSVIAVDRDHDCVEHTIDGSPDVLGLVADICNPSPAIGWENTERKSFLDRLNVGTIIALALIHHICIGNNTPLSKVAELLAGHCKSLIIEFVPLEDPKAKLLAGIKTFPPYSRDIFESEFIKYFQIVQEQKIKDSLRSIYLMLRR